MDRHVELGAGLGGLLLQRVRAEGTGEDEPPEGFDGSVEVLPACVRRLAGTQAAAEEAQRILNAPVLGDPRVRRERHHLVEGEAGLLPPALLLVLLRGQVPVGAPASRGVAANVLSLEGVGEEDADDAGEAPDGAGPDGLVVPPAQVCPEGEEPVEKIDLALVGGEVCEDPVAELRQEVVLQPGVVVLPGERSEDPPLRKPDLLEELLDGGSHNGRRGSDQSHGLLLPLDLGEQLPGEHRVGRPARLAPLDAPGVHPLHPEEAGSTSSVDRTHALPPASLGADAPRVVLQVELPSAGRPVPPAAPAAERPA